MNYSKSAVGAVNFNPTSESNLTSEYKELAHEVSSPYTRGSTLAVARELYAKAVFPVHAGVNLALKI
jgi:hypothetical protein